MRVFIEGVGLMGPGLNGWEASRLSLMDNAAYLYAPTVVPMSDFLPAAERRRVGVPVKLALAVACEALTNAGRDFATTATVFTSSGGDNDNVHLICETLVASEREVSPTRFHNSVHNAAAGYWSIAARSHEPSTSLCCYDASFSAGLLEAATQVVLDGKPVTLIAYDHFYPEPLRAVRPIGANFGMALVLTPQSTSRTLAVLEVDFMPGAEVPTRLSNHDLESLRISAPAARSLPLLTTLARNVGELLNFEYLTETHLCVAMAPC